MKEKKLGNNGSINVEKLADKFIIFVNVVNFYYIHLRPAERYIMINKQEVVYYVQLAEAIKVISTEAEHEAVSSSRIMKKSLHRHCRKSWKEQLKIMSSDMT